jgi:Transglycosylase SLT domain
MTAAERLLRDPFDPVQALPKSAEFLRQLRAQFGNLGLAAAAYNAGPQRLRDWLAGKRTLPSETRIYVRNATGRSVQEWALARSKIFDAHNSHGNVMRSKSNGEGGCKAAIPLRRCPTEADVRLGPPACW